MIYVGEIKNASGVYVITNIESNKIYIGSSVNLYTRFKRHRTDLNKGTHPNTHLLNAWNKYGEDKFSFAIIELVPDKNKLIEREQYWINTLNACDDSIGYNISPVAGSALGRKQTDEERKKRKLLNNRPVLQFDLNGNLIKEWYSATVMSKDLNIDRFIILNRLKRKSKFNDSYLIYKDEFTNELLNDVLLLKREPSNAKKVNQYNKNGIYMRTWESIKLAAETLNIQSTHITDVCKGKYSQCGGFIWSYVD